MRSENQKVEHRKYMKEYMKNRYATNLNFREKRRIYKENRLKNNEIRNKYNEYRRSCYLEHPELRKIKNIKQRLRAKTLKGKESLKRSHVKRKRQLGFSPINDYFKDSDAHHINKTDIIYIPAALHESHYGHRLDIPETMHEINKVAFQYLTETMKQL